MPAFDEIASDVVSETVHVGFGQKLAGSVAGALFGLLLIVGSGWGLFWNEGRAVTTARSLSEGAGQVVSINTIRVEPANEGRLVHVTGPLTTTASLSDPEFGVTAAAATLVRKVEMFQWKEDQKTETHKNFGGSEERTTTYTYTRTWSSTRIESDRFKQNAGHTNPQMRYQRLAVAAKDATLGAFRPGENVLRRLSATEVVRVDPALAARVQQRVVGGKAQIVDGQIYLGADPANPAIGDLRISYQVANPSTISVVGSQTGADFSPYQTKAGDKLLFAKSGTVPAAEIFAHAQDENRILTWIIRAAGVIFMMVGFALLASPLIALGDIVPFIGSILGVGAFIVAVFMTAIVAPAVIAVAWLWYRPLVAIAVLGAGVGVALLTRTLAPKRKVAAGVRPSGAVAQPR